MDANNPSPEVQGASAEPTIHELKLWTEFFAAVEAGAKTFELRKNDRGFKVGDLLTLLEYDPNEEQYVTDSKGIVNRVMARITYMVQGVFGLPKDVAVMSIEVFKPHPTPSVESQGAKPNDPLGWNNLGTCDVHFDSSRENQLHQPTPQCENFKKPARNPPTSTHEGSSPESETDWGTIFKVAADARNRVSKSSYIRADEQRMNAYEAGFACGYHEALHVTPARELGSKEGAGTVTEEDRIAAYTRWHESAMEHDDEPLIALLAESYAKKRQYSTLHAAALKLAEGQIIANGLDCDRNITSWRCEVCAVTGNTRSMEHRSINGSSCPVGIVKGEKP